MAKKKTTAKPDEVPTPSPIPTASTWTPPPLPRPKNFLTAQQARDKGLVPNEVVISVPAKRRDR